jgi:hypothetical protein
MASSTISSTVVIHIKHLNPSDITYGSARSLDNGAKNIPVLYKGKPLVVQTEDMRTPFGVRDAYGAPSGGDADSMASGKKTIEFSVEKDSAPEVFDKLSAMDSIIVTDALRNSKAWFRKVHDNRDVLESLYSPMLRFHRDRDTGEITQRYAPLFKANLPIKQGVMITEIYDANRERIDVAQTDLRGARAVAILQCSGIWVAGGKFGCSWKVLQMRVSAVPSSKISCYAFIEDGDNDIANDSAKDV